MNLNLNQRNKRQVIPNNKNMNQENKLYNQFNNNALLNN